MPLTERPGYRSKFIMPTMCLPLLTRVKYCNIFFSSDALHNAFFSVIHGYTLYIVHITLAMENIESSNKIMTCTDNVALHTKPFITTSSFTVVVIGVVLLFLFSGLRCLCHFFSTLL